jgi:hypothetical protein
VGSRAAAGAPDRLVVARRNGYAVTRGRCRTCHRRVPSGLGDALLELPGERSVPPVSLSAEVQVFERNLERQFAERAHDRTVGSPLRLLLDTHVIDELAADPSLRLQLRRAVEAGTVVLLVTHLQIDEVLAMPLQKMEHQQELLHQLGSLVPLESLRPAPCDDGAGGTSRRGCPTMTRNFWTP